MPRSSGAAADAQADDVAGELRAPLLIDQTGSSVTFDGSSVEIARAVLERRSVGYLMSRPEDRMKARPRGWSFPKW